MCKSMPVCPTDGAEAQQSPPVAAVKQGARSAKAQYCRDGSESKERLVSIVEQYRVDVQQAVPLP